MEQDEADDLTGTLTSNSVTWNSSEEGDEGQDCERDVQHCAADSDGDIDSLCEELGLLFEGSHAMIWKHFSWDKMLGDSTTKAGRRSQIHVAISCIDDNPGTVQSGHYLWPAAESLCEYLMRASGEKNDKPFSGSVRSILELGAGTALPSLCAVQLFQETLEYLVVTDRDYGTLERARDNYETTMMELYENAGTDEGQESVVNEISSILVDFLPLTWEHHERQWKELTKRLQLDHSILKTDSGVTFDLVLGSDLMYSVDVIEPLLETVKMAMVKNTCGTLAGRFLLSQSFALDKDAEKEIDRVCRVLHLSSKTVQDTLSANGTKILEFRHMPA
ncbi:lysine methyltransferase [Nitzschia inconspicua]|uniref:Lysine methyltransferase n=1 Tax=Nitzschia inconspicua TaxID=303405 RepID=A0A9K3Q7T4_9STRA|nr:lysine methyltransferase [Nitzschia inconspicua]